MSGSDVESSPSGRTYIEPIPEGYRAEWLTQPLATPRGNTIVSTNDASRL